MADEEPNVEQESVPAETPATVGAGAVASQEEQEEACRKIQSQVRGRQARKTVKHRKEKLLLLEGLTAEEAAEKERQAIKIQSHMRGHLSRKKARPAVDQKTKELEALHFQEREVAREIVHIDPTTFFEDEKAKAELKAMEDKFQQSDQQNEKYLEELRAAREEQEQAALRIQAVYHRKLENQQKRHAREKKAEQEYRRQWQEERRQRAELNAAAVRIQSRYRGHNTRKRVATARAPKTDDTTTATPTTTSLPQPKPVSPPAASPEEMVATPSPVHSPAPASSRPVSSVGDVEAPPEEKMDDGPQARARESVRQVITKWAIGSSYVYSLQPVASSSPNTFYFDTVWSKPAIKKPIPATVVHIYFAVQHPMEDNEEIVYRLENQDTEHTIGGLGLQFKELWLDQVMEDKRCCEDRYKL